MELNDFVREFSKQFDESSSKGIDSATRFQDLDEWSSLTELLVIVMINEQCHTQIFKKDIRNVATVEELYNLIKDK
ncbi:MAG: acyl carrier protein [Bacteroidota bacterium]|nr:acyl carrier protein [Bacteroidota bacterium]